MEAAVIICQITAQTTADNYRISLFLSLSQSQHVSGDA
jgi:hypothetical protein